MKIGIYDPYLNTLGGGEKYILTVASCLAKKDEVFLFWDDHSLLEKAEKRFKLSLKEVKTTTNIFNPKIPFINRFKASGNYEKIIYLSDGSIPIIRSDLYVHFQFPVNWVNVNYLTKRKIKRIKKIICNSQFTKDLIDKKFRVNSNVIYPPVGEPAEKEIKKEKMILTVGRYNSLSDGNSFKKHEVMVRTFKEMADKGLKNFDFIIVTNFLKEEEDNIKNLKRLAEGYNIKILEDLTSDELNDYYSKALIYWHASGFEEDLVRNPQRAEHFGISTVEAMSYKAIPVVFNAGGQKEIVDDNLNGFLWNDTEELKEKTLKIINDEKIIKNFSSKAYSKSQEFTGDRFCEELLKLINE